MAHGLISEVEAQRHKVVVEPFTPTWNELLDQYKNGDLQVDPVYQRAFRWSYVQQTRYIESILLNIPTPPIFLAEMPNGKFEVIDGLQRFSTILKFFSGEIFKPSFGAALAGEASSNKDVQNDIKVGTVLSEAPILKSLEGLELSTFPETLVRTLRYARIQVILLKKESSTLARYHVFTRLNRAGTVLSDQEIRNCSARLFDSGFADQLMELGRDPLVAGAMGLSSGESNSMGAQQNVLRLIAFSNFSPTTQRIDEFLDDAMYKVASGEVEVNAAMQERIVKTFEVIGKAFPNGEAFRFYKDGKFKGAFSSNLFDIIACGVYKNVQSIKNKPPAQLRKLIRDLHAQPEALALTGAGSNTRAKMIGRVKFGKKWFS